MPYGYNGKILHLDLTKGTWEVETPPEAFYRQYMGGGAMGMYYVLRDMPAKVDPLSPASVITLMDSVVTGAPISGQSRINANAKSPFTGFIGDSQAGGFFPAELKFAGFDGIVIKGQSPKPVYLTIIEGEVALHDASHLTGRTTGEVEEILKKETGQPKAQIIQHGPAAERGVLFSSLVNMCSRNNGRNGMGLVMASKRLRAIVVRGTKKMALADPDALKALNKRGPKLMAENPDMDGLGKYGTSAVLIPNHNEGILPTRNYNEGQFEHAEEISGEYMADTILKERDTCYACVVRCKRVVEVSGKYHADPTYGGPEYENVAVFGSYCGVGSLEPIAHANQLCNSYGVDAITCGATVAFAMECFEKGIIGLEQTGGIELRFGNADAMVQTVEQIVTNSGPLGKVLSQGSYRAAKVWGPAAEECLITCKGQEMPAHMPHGKKSLALIYAVNSFGADHQSSEHDWGYEEGMALPLHLERMAMIGLTNPTPKNDFGPEKVKFAVYGQRFYSMMDTLELCQFVYGPAWQLYGPDETVEMVRAITGWDVSIDELMTVGERRINMLRAFNAREGFNRTQDTLPNKIFKPLGGVGPTAGTAISKQEFEAALDRYYQLCGWTEDGIPTRAKLDELGLAWIKI